MTVKMHERFHLPPFETFLDVYRILAAITVITVIVLTSAKLINHPLARPDIEVYLHAANVILGGNNPYLTGMRTGVFYYLYPPLFALLFIPFTLLPINVTVVVWCVLNVLLLGWAMKVFYESLAGEPFFEIPIRTRWTISFFALLPTFRFIYSHLAFGQSDIVVLALVVLGLVWLQKDRRLAAGAAIGISIAIKLISLPFAIWFAARRNLRVTLGIACGLLAGLLLPALLVGFGKNSQFLNYWFRNVLLYSDLRNTYWPFHDNFSLHAQLYRFFSNSVAFIYNGQPYHLTLFVLPLATLRILEYLVVAVVAGLVVLYAVLYRNHGVLIEHWGGIALTFSVVPLFPTVLQKHYLVLLLPSYIYVLHLWYSVHLQDKVFRGLVAASMAVLTLISAAFSGEFLNEVFATGGCYPLGVLLLSASIFRAASRLPANS